MYSIGTQWPSTDKTFLEFLLGPDLKSCLRALEASNVTDSLHIVERINLELLLQTSILPSHAKLPSMIQIPRIKVSGKLPTLQINVSDTKYKALMRFVDTAIPKLSDGTSRQSPVGPEKNPPSTFRLPSGLFGTEGTTEYESDDERDDNKQEGEGEFVDAHGATAAVSNYFWIVFSGQIIECFLLIRMLINSKYLCLTSMLTSCKL